MTTNAKCNTNAINNDVILTLSVNVQNFTTLKLDVVPVTNIAQSYTFNPTFDL